MATQEQEFMFGDFGDLSPEEHDWVYGILHGPGRNGPSKVEFPWVDGPEDLVGAMGGGVYNGQAWVDDIPEYMTAGDTGYQSNSYLDTGNYPVQYGYGDCQSQDPVASQNFMMPQDHMGTEQARMDEEAAAQSKLQANTKQYQRRNKKKRPANYYDSASGSMESDSQSVHENPLEYQAQYNIGPLQGEAMQHPTFRSEYHVPAERMPSQNMPSYPNVNPSHQPPPPVPNQNFAAGGNFMEYDSFADRHVSYANTTMSNCEKDTSVQAEERLFEVVVEKVPESCVRNTPERTEIPRGGHPDRTIVSYPPTTIVNSNVNSANIDGRPSHQAAPSVGANVHTPVIVTNSVNVQSPNNSIPEHSGRVNVSVNDGLVMDYSSHPGQPCYQGQSNAPRQPSYQGQPMATAQPQERTSEVINQVCQPDIHASVPNYSTVDNHNVNIPSAVHVNDVNINSAIETAQPMNESANAKPQSDNVVVETNDSKVVPVNQTTVNGTPTTPSIPESKPKMTSWAGLFKSTSSAPVVASPFPGAKADSSAGKPEVEERMVKEASPQPVPAAEDSVAKQLGEFLSSMSINHGSVCLQPRGLINRGNWCYINGTLQALIACPPFYSLLKKLPRYPALSRGPSSTPILDALVEFVHEFQPMNRSTEKGPRARVREVSPGVPFEPSYVYKMLQVIAVNPHFKLGKQEDAEEFLSCILDGMHEEMSAAVMLTEKHTQQEDDGYTNGYVEGDNEEELDNQPEEESWEQVGPKKKSVHTRRAQFAKTPIADIFAGMIRSVVHKATSKETATLEPFFTLQLDIQAERVCSVKDALEGLVSKEPITGYTCPKTKSEVEVWKKLSLEELPPVLIMHLKFFVYNKDGGSQKLMKRVEYPVELEITKDLLSPNARSKLNLQQRSYKLFAVVYHHGKTSTGGHYTTSVFHPGINGWVFSDDSQVRTTMVGNVLKYSPPRVPYLLYYRRLDSH